MELPWSYPISLEMVPRIYILIWAHQMMNLIHTKFWELLPSRQSYWAISATFRIKCYNPADTHVLILERLRPSHGPES